MRIAGWPGGIAKVSAYTLKGLEPAALRMVLVMHQRNPGGHARIGFFFEPLRWDGEPANREPAKCSGLLWADPDNLPAQTVPYTAAAISRIQQGTTFALNGWGPAPGDPEVALASPRPES